MILLVIGLVLAGLAGLLHVYIFVMESITWTKPATWKRFGIHSQEEAETIRPMALNQGFYNLFLALGVFVGLTLVATSFGTAIVIFACSSMVAAALVLIVSNRSLARAAITQGTLPLLALIALVLGLVTS
jgi:putative membrane protein